MITLLTIDVETEVHITILYWHWWCCCNQVDWKIQKYEYNIFPTTAAAAATITTTTTTKSYINKLMKNMNEFINELMFNDTFSWKADKLLEGNVLFNNTLYLQLYGTRQKHKGPSDT